MENSLSIHLGVITEEIQFYKQQAGQAVFEIGKRLKHVHDNALAGTGFKEWAKDNCDFEPETAYRFIKAYEQFGKVTTSSLPTGKIFEMLSLPKSIDRQEFIEKQHTIPSTGEQKTVDEMTVKELREVKKQLQDIQRQAAEAQSKATSAQNSANHFEKLWNQAKNQPKQIQTVTKTVEVIPDDYQDLKNQARVAQELNTEVVKLKRSLNEQREHYESMIREDEKKDQALKELRKNLSDLLKNAAMFHESAIFYHNQIPGNREAYLAVTSFLNQYSEVVQGQFNEWKSLTAVKAAN